MKYLQFVFFIILFVACKHGHKHEVSEELKQAFEIQQNALKVNAGLDERLKDFGVVPPNELMEKRSKLISNMIEIPGMDHDHKNCNHDHSRPTFKISDAEMILVQSEWRDSLQKVNMLIEQYVNKKR